VWLFNDKFDYLFSQEEKQRRNKAEEFVFKTSVGMKMMSVFFFMQLRLYRRPVGRSYAFDLLLVYLGAYSFLGSNIPGVYYTWPMYQDLAQKLLQSEKLRKRGLRNTHEFLDQTADL